MKKSEFYEYVRTGKIKKIEENKSSIIPYTDSPLTFIISDNNISLENGDEENKNDNYGFLLIINNKEKEYPTQCKIISYKIEDDKLKIYEKGKFDPWIFDSNGKLINNATFDYIEKERDYIKIKTLK